MTLAPPRTVVDGLMFGEGPRWHEGALVFSDMHAPHRPRRAGERRRPRTREHGARGHRRRAIGARVAARRTDARRRDGDPTAPAPRARRHAGGTRRPLEPGAGSLNDMIVATDGTAYVGDMGVRIQEGGERVPGQTFRVAPDGGVVRGRRPAVAERPRAHRRRPHTDRGRERGARLPRSTCATTAPSTDVAPTPLVPASDDVPVAAPDGICLDAEQCGWRTRSARASCACFAGRGHRHDRLRRRDPGGLRARWTRPSHAPDVRGRRLEARRGAAAPVGPHRRLRRGNTGQAAPT